MRQETSKGIVEAIIISQEVVLMGITGILNLIGGFTYRPLLSEATRLINPLYPGSVRHYLDSPLQQGKEFVRRKISLDGRDFFVESNDNFPLWESFLQHRGKIQEEDYFYKRIKGMTTTRYKLHGEIKKQGIVLGPPIPINSSRYVDHRFTRHERGLFWHVFNCGKTYYCDTVPLEKTDEYQIHNGLTKKIEGES